MVRLDLAPIAGEQGTHMATNPTLIPGSAIATDGGDIIRFNFDQPIAGLSATDVVVKKDGAALNVKGGAYTVSGNGTAEVVVTLTPPETTDTGEAWTISMAANVVFGVNGVLGNLAFTDEPVSIASRSRSRDRTRAR